MWLFVRNLLFTVIVPGTVAGWLPCRIGFREHKAMWPSNTHLAGGVMLFAVGAAIYLRCVWDFAVIGRGTPAPIDAPRVLVVRGLYRYVRNPIYVGVLTIVLGWAVSFGSLWILIYAVALALAFHLFVVGVEEPSIRRQFGESYERYCHQVGRWRPGSGS